MLSGWVALRAMLDSTSNNSRNFSDAQCHPTNLDRSWSVAITTANYRGPTTQSRSNSRIDGEEWLRHRRTEERQSLQIRISVERQEDRGDYDSSARGW